MDDRNQEKNFFAKIFLGEALFRSLVKAKNQDLGIKITKNCE